MSNLPKDNPASDPPAQARLESEATTDASSAGESAPGEMSGATDRMAPTESPSLPISQGDQTQDYVPRTPIYMGETVDDPDRSTKDREAPEPAEAQGARRSSSPRPGSTAEAPKTPPTPDRFPSIPGYEIIGVLGRGAMGVVYKARQRGLKRVVALKTILAGDDADENELSRFRTEAEAAGQLQHPHIVQIHEVGEYHGGPYLSLEFVNGGSLKDRLNGEPQPVLPAAQLTQVLSQAIDYAHRQGIVHRDLKPANVMLELPRGDGSTQSTMSGAPLVEQLYGIPKIADFGLAKRLEEDSGQTRSGTILGTPSYMAPEQARGFSKDVGPPADQHALGAILYELLTGRPPFRGASMWETIEQVQKQEPVPPSRLQPKVPRDLETICLKCLQKEPTRRYKDAGALAEDLRRFVSGEPIQARPVSAPERVLRWCRRNPRVAALLGFIVILLVVGITGLIIFNFKLSREKEEKDKERLAAVAAKEEAQDNYNLAMDQRGLVLDVMGTVITKISDRLKEKPGMQPLRRELLLSVQKDLDRVAENVTVDISLAEVSKAAIFFQLGQLYLEIGETQTALNLFQKCFETFDFLAKKEPDNDKIRSNLCVPLTRMGFAYLKLHGDKSKARDFYLKALTLLREIDQHPRKGNVEPVRIKDQLANALNLLGSVTIDSQPEEALSYYQEALQQRLALVDLNDKKKEAEQAVASTHLMVGGAHFWLGDQNAARKANEIALGIIERLAQEHKEDLGVERELAFALQRQGDLELRSNHAARAGELYSRALGIYQSLVERDPKHAGYQEDLARAQYDVATAALRAGDPGAAQKMYAASSDLRQARLRAEPESVSLKKDLMITLARCGNHFDAARIAEEIRSLPEDGGSLVEVAGCYALCVSAVENPEGRTPGAKLSVLTHEDQKLRLMYVARAVDALKQAVARGYRNVVNLETEPDLDPIRDNVEFQALLEKMKVKR